MASLLAALNEIEPAPCDVCEKKLLCRNERLACMTFATYVNYGHPSVPTAHIESRKRKKKASALRDDIPSRAMYKRIFKSESFE